MCWLDVYYVVKDVHKRYRAKIFKKNNRIDDDFNDMDLLTRIKITELKLEIKCVVELTYIYTE